jgi:hypothetical protein
METNNMNSGGDSQGFDLLEPLESSAPESVAQDGGERDPSKQSASTDKPAVNAEDKLNKELTRSNNAPTPKAEGEIKPKEQQKEKFVPRSEQRKQEIQQGLAELKKEREEFRKEREAFLAQRNQQPANPQNQPQDGKSNTPEFVEKPQAPQYSRDQLKQMQLVAQKEGNQDALSLINEEFSKWDKYDTKLEIWELKNGEAIKSFQTKWTDSWKKTVEKIPDMAKEDSPVRQQAEKLAKQYPEVFNRRQADGQYILGQIAKLMVDRKSHASEVAALKDQITKLTEQLDSSQKKIQPAGQSSKPNISDSKTARSPEEKLAQRLGVS